QRDRAAVRVRDDPVVLERPRAVYLGDDERHAFLQAIRGRLVDDDGASTNGMRHELARGGRSDREEAEVEVAAGQRLRRRFLDGDPARALAGRARRGERAHVRVTALAKQLERDRADGTGRADHSDARVLTQARTPR